MCTFHLVPMREACGRGDREQLIRHPPAHGNLRGEVEMHPHSPGTRQSCRPASPAASTPRPAGLKHITLQAVGFLGPPTLSLSFFLCCRLVSHRHCRKAAAFSRSRLIGLACLFSGQGGCFGGAFPTLSPGLCVRGGKGLVVRAPSRE